MEQNMKLLLKAVRRSKDYYSVGRGCYAIYHIAAAKYYFYKMNACNLFGTIYYQHEKYLGTLVYHKQIKQWIFAYKFPWITSKDYKILDGTLDNLKRTIYHYLTAASYLKMPADPQF
jgi:hypothetical protein